MRRILSTIFLVIGGWLLASEPLLAFIDFGPDDPPAKPFMLLGVLIFVAVPLAIGVALSPGKRWRELGLTVLIATGVGLFCGLCMLAVFNDPAFQQMKPALPPMPRMVFGPIAGAVNALVLIAIGWLLYRSGKADPGSSPG